MKAAPPDTTPRGARLRAGATAALLLLTGAVLGIAADRLWRSPGPAEATPLTARAMADDLGLSAEEEARLNALLDSLHLEVMAAATQGAGALQAAAQAAHQRIEASLPEEARAGFHTWLQGHHDRMMHRMMHPGRGPGGGMGPSGPVSP